MWYAELAKTNVHKKPIHFQGYGSVDKPLVGFAY